jgi:hypothetical protein
MIAGDFLQVQAPEISHVDAIVMNPPFSADENHILHAWDIAPGGCTIVSLCNKNTVYGYASNAKQEQLSDLINLYGTKEDFGDCFAEAERKTGVEVACVWLYKPKTGNEEFDDYFSLDEEPQNVEAGIVRYDYVYDIVNRYVGAVKLFDRIEPLANEVNEMTKPIAEHGIKFGAYYTGNSNGNYKSITRETYKKELQKQAWGRIFTDLNMDKYVTKGVKSTLNKFVETQVHVPFTMKNIYKMLEIIVGTHGSRINQVLVEAFETICGYSWKENCTGGEGWKTNSDYVVNRKFIVPYICESEWYKDHVYVSFGGRAADIDDVAKALCYISGMNYNDCSKLSEFVNKTKMAWGQWYEWGFFRIRGYKKGTMHFEFADAKVWEQFNRRVAEIKGWALPQTSNTTKKEKKEL